MSTDSEIALAAAQAAAGSSTTASEAASAAALALGQTRALSEIDTADDAVALLVKPGVEGVKVKEALGSLATGPSALRDGIETAAGDVLQRQVANRVAESLAADDTPAQAAAAAVTADIAGRNMLEAYPNDDDAFRIVDEDYYEAFSVETDGRVNAHDLRVRQIRDSDPGGSLSPEWSWTDEDGNVALAVQADGKTFIADPVFGNPEYQSGGSGSSTTISRVRLLIGIGQSNMEGRQRPYSARLDPPIKRIEMWDWPSDSLKTATVPLSSQQQQTGKSPLSWIGKYHHDATGPDTAIVLLNAAAGGSGLVAQPSQGTWDVDYAGANPRLYSIAVAEIDKTLAAISAKYPGATVETWIYWHQGEADGGTSETSYATELDQLVTSLRSHLGSTTIPFTAGGIVPEYRAQTGPDRALINLPARLEYVAYADGVLNGGGSQNTGDTVHYTREGGEILSQGMYEASHRAAVASADSIAHKPLTVDATYIGGTLRASWSAPMCRFTAFIVEYRIDGGAWVAATRDLACDVHQTVTGLTGSVVEVRVATVNGASTSAYTTPVTALGV